MGLGQSSEQSVGPQDMNKFRTIMFVVLAIGAVASIAFHLTVTEKESSVSGYEEIQGDADLVSQTDGHEGVEQGGWEKGLLHSRVCGWLGGCHMGVLGRYPHLPVV